MLIKGPIRVDSAWLNVTLNLTVPSIHLLHVCQYSDIKPKAIHSVMIYNVTWNEALIVWKYRSRYSQ